MKITVTCECGKEIEVLKTVAAKVLVKGRKQQSTEQLKENGRKGALIRWSKIKNKK